MASQTQFGFPCPSSHILIFSLSYFFPPPLPLPPTLVGLDQARHTPASASQSGAMRIFITGLARGLLGLQPFDIEGYG